MDASIYRAFIFIIESAATGKDQESHQENAVGPGGRFSSDTLRTQAPSNAGRARDSMAAPPVAKAQVVEMPPTATAAPVYTVANAVGAPVDHGQMGVVVAEKPNKCLHIWLMVSVVTKRG